jgi:hypothetical protein
LLAATILLTTSCSTGDINNAFTSFFKGTQGAVEIEDEPIIGAPTPRGDSATLTSGKEAPSPYKPSKQEHVPSKETIVETNTGEIDPITHPQKPSPSVTVKESASKQQAEDLSTDEITSTYENTVQSDSTNEEDFVKAFMENPNFHEIITQFNKNYIPQLEPEEKHN